jgi:hypothetical protein
MPQYTLYGYQFVDLNKLIQNIHIIFHSDPPFVKYRGFSVVHCNNLKVTIFSERRLGMKNKIYIQNHLAKIYKLVLILSILWHF